MSVYLKDIPLSEAKEIFWKALDNEGVWQRGVKEEIPLNEDACGRILAEPVWAKLSSPHYHASAMDGFALKAEDTRGALPSSPIVLSVGEQASLVDTGDPIPEWANAVVPIELVESLEANGSAFKDIRKPAFIRLRAAIAPWSHIRPMGEDIIASQLVVPEGQVLRPVDLGAIAAAGHDRVAVKIPPKVGILPTGSELVSIGEAVKKGDVIEYNSIVLAAQVNNWGGEAHRYDPAIDEYDKLLFYVQRVADENDLVLINAGSSAGSEDYTASVIEALGTLLVHGVAVRPGHPVILGFIKRSSKAEDEGMMVPVIGVPGFPVSAALTGEIFVEPILAKWLGKKPHEAEEITAILTRKITSPPGDEDYVRVVCGSVGERMLAAPLARGAGVISSLVKADGVTVVPRGIQGLDAGSSVKVRIYRSRNELERTIFSIGSHDMTLDLLAQYLAKEGVRFVSSNAGSVGGLIALKKGEAHLAGTHLLDASSGEYNLPYLEQYLPGMQVEVITWVYREQGLVIRPGNPKAIKDLQDLARIDITFVNRQRGAGTRVLLDYHLERLNIDANNVNGYHQEEYSHLAVAAAVASGRADCGLVVKAAAIALRMDFIPLFDERYDFVIPRSTLSDRIINPLMDLFDDPIFTQEVAALPGYDVKEMGQVVYKNFS